MLSIVCAVLLNTPFAAYGDETMQQIRRDFYLPESRLYGEERTPDEPTKQVSFNWGVGVMLSALNAAAKRDDNYVPWLREYADATEVYWNPVPPVAGFDVLPGPKGADRYYDDNEWMVMSLVETSEVLHD